jgi:hypothetical protein
VVVIPQLNTFIGALRFDFSFGKVFKLLVKTNDMKATTKGRDQNDRDQFDSTEKMPTLTEKINIALQQGYTENFKISARGLTDELGGKYYSASEIHIPNFHRFEGYSDPQDNAILYWIETSDGRKGILIDAYGAYADVKVNNFIREVEDIQKTKK